jgi:hypothetical protein
MMTMMAASTTTPARTQATICITRTAYISDSPAITVTTRIALQKVTSAVIAIRRATGRSENTISSYRRLRAMTSRWISLVPS